MGVILLWLAFSVVFALGWFLGAAMTMRNYVETRTGSAGGAFQKDACARHEPRAVRPVEAWRQAVHEDG